MIMKTATFLKFLSIAGVLASGALGQAAHAQYLCSTRSGDFVLDRQYRQVEGSRCDGFAGPGVVIYVEDGFDQRFQPRPYADTGRRFERSMPTRRQAHPDQRAQTIRKTTECAAGSPDPYSFGGCMVGRTIYDELLVEGDLFEDIGDTVEDIGDRISDLFD
jgi:hypothetical protein